MPTTIKTPWQRQFKKLVIFLGSDSEENRGWQLIGFTLIGLLMCLKFLTVIVP